MRPQAVRRVRPMQGYRLYVVGQPSWLERHRPWVTLAVSVVLGAAMWAIAIAIVRLRLEGIW